MGDFGGVEVKVYNADPCMGKPLPPINNLEYVKGDKGELKPNVVTVVYFFQCFYKGGFIVNEELTQLSEKFPQGVQFVAISNDPEKEKVEKLLQKIAAGTCCDEVTKQVFRLGVPWVAWDQGKVLTKQFSDICNTSVLHTPQAFIVDGHGKIQWRQPLLQNYKFSDTNFGDQLAAVIAGKAITSPHGDRPKVEAAGEAACEGEDEMSLF